MYSSSEYIILFKEIINVEKIKFRFFSKNPSCSLLHNSLNICFIWNDIHSTNKAFIQSRINPQKNLSLFWQVS